MAVKRIFALMLLILAFAVHANAASTAKQVDFLLAGIEKDGDPCTGCKVYTYETGTTTAKATYLDRLKASAATNPIVLDSEGRAEIFADGLYKFVIKTAADASYFDIDGLDYGATGAQFVALSQYGSLEEAIADIGGTETVLIMDTTSTLNANLTIPTNVTLHVFSYDSIDLNGKTLTMNGGIVAPPIEWIVGSTGTFTGSPIVQFYDPTWTASTVTDSATPDYKAIQLVGAVLNSVSAITNKITFSNTVSFSKGADIPSAATLQLGADGNYFDVTGTTEISNISGRGAGTAIKLHFDDALTIINSANIENIGAVNITTATGDEAEFIEYDTSQWRMTTYSGHVAASFRGALVYNSGAQSAPDSLTTNVVFDSEAYDTDDIHSTVSNTERLTVPAGVTKVKVSALVTWGTDPNGYRSADIWKNGAPFTGRGYDIRNAVSAGIKTTSNNPISAVVDASGGDFFYLRALQTSGSSLDISPTSTWFAMEVIE
jgi:hypothetical protein